MKKRTVQSNLINLRYRNAIGIAAVSFIAPIVSIIARICYDAVEVFWLKIIPSVFIIMSMIISIFFTELSNEEEYLLITIKNKKIKTIFHISMGMSIIVELMIFISIFVYF